MEIIRRAKKEDAEYIRGLLQQLISDTSKVVPDIRATLEDPTCHCFVVEHDGEVVGTGTLTISVSLTKGRAGRFEDIVIDEKMRGKGLGRKLVVALLNHAKEENLTTIELTSNKTRHTARNLYETLGFIMIDTDVFRLSI